MDFSQQNLVSLLDGNRQLYCVLNIRFSTNIYIENLDLFNGVASNDTDWYNRGGGAHVQKSSAIIITNTKIHNNYAKNDGGGLFVIWTTDSMFHVDVYNNHANWGGGILADYSDRCLFFGSAYNNYAYEQAGGIKLQHGHVHYVNMQISNNSCSHYNGGGIVFSSSDSNTLLGEIQYNVTSNSTYGGFYNEVSVGHTIGANIHNNTPLNNN